VRNGAQACLLAAGLLLVQAAAADPIDALRGRIMVDLADGDFIAAS
jgi:hypothetical protein